MKPIHLTLQVSKYLCSLLVAGGLLFIAMIYFVPMAAWLRMLCVLVLVMIATYFCLRDAFLKLPNSVVAIHINNKNQLTLVRKDGQQLVVQVLANTVVTSFLTVLNCQLIEANFWQKLFHQHVIILPDAVNGESYRQLRVWLRWAKNILPQTAALVSAEDKIV